MPGTVSIGEQITRFSQKTAPDRVGTRYGAKKSMAVALYLDRAAPYAFIVDEAKRVLAQLGVPTAEYGIYIAFVEMLYKKAEKHSGKTLADVVTGLKARFVNKGCDPEVLDVLTKLVLP